MKQTAETEGGEQSSTSQGRGSSPDAAKPPNKEARFNLISTRKGFEGQESHGTTNKEKKKKKHWKSRGSFCKSEGTSSNNKEEVEEWGAAKGKSPSRLLHRGRILLWPRPKKGAFRRPQERPNSTPAEKSGRSKTGGRII